MSFWKNVAVATCFLCGFLCWTSCGDIYRPVAQVVVKPGPDPQRTNYVYALYTNPAPNGAGILSRIDATGDITLANLRLGRGPMAATYQNGVTTNAIYVANSDGTVTYQLPASFQLPVTLNLFADSTVPGFVPPQPAWIVSSQSNGIYAINRTGPQPACPSNVGSVSVLSASLLATLCVGNNPTFGVQIPGGGKVYVLNTGAGTVSIIDPALLQVESATIPVGTSPVWAALNGDASRLYILCQGGGLGGNGRVYVVNTTTDAVVTSFDVGLQPNFAIFEKNRNRLYVTNGGSGTLSVIDLSHGDPTGVLASIRTTPAADANPNPTSAAPLPDGTRIYVANTGTADVAVIDANSLSLRTGNAGYCTKPITTEQVSCPNRYDTIPLLWDLTQWSGTVAPTPIAFTPEIAATAGGMPLRIETEPTSTKVYVTTPYAVPQPGADPIQPAVTVIRTIDNRIPNYIPGPQQDVNCQPNPAAHTVCPGQIPVSILSIPR